MVPPTGAHNLLREQTGASRSYFGKFNTKEISMNKDQVDGAGKQAKGAVKDAVGGLTGDAKLQAEGKMDKAEGKVQQKVGDVKNDVRKALDD